MHVKLSVDQQKSLSYVKAHVSTYVNTFIVRNPKPAQENFYPIQYSPRYLITTAGIRMWLTQQIYATPMLH